MYVDLAGNPESKTIVIQPVAYTDGNVIVTPEAPSTEGEMGRLMLVQ